MDPLGALGARPRPCVEGGVEADRAGQRLVGLVLVRTGSIRPIMESACLLLLRSAEEEEERRGGRAVGPAALYL